MSNRPTEAPQLSAEELARWEAAIERDKQPSTATEREWRDYCESFLPQEFHAPGYAR